VQTSLRFEGKDADLGASTLWHASTRSTVVVPADKAVVLKLGLVEGGERAYRLLILRAR